MYLNVKRGVGYLIDCQDSSWVFNYQEMSRYVMVKRGVGYVMVKRGVEYLIVKRGIGYLIDIQEIPIKKCYFLDYI